MNEEEAKTKWCPMARVRWGDESASANRDHRGGWGDAESCIASQCMAWRWHSEYLKQTGYCGFAK